MQADSLQICHQLQVSQEAVQVLVGGPNYSASLLLALFGLEMLLPIMSLTPGTACAEYAMILVLPSPKSCMPDGTPLALYRHLVRTVLAQIPANIAWHS